MLTSFQKRKLAKRFYLFDHERTGRIGWSDIRRVLDNVLEISGWSMDSGQRAEFLRQGHTGWQLLVAAADVDEDGEVDLEEWYAFYDQHVYPEANRTGALPAWLRALNDLSFSAMDANRDGRISRHEYRQLLRAYGVEDEGLEESFAHIDTSGDGFISREEWKALNRNYYLAEDESAPSSWLWGDVFKAFFR
jgi:Ca2+-binding EF-hand superfamily protein